MVFISPLFWRDFPPTSTSLTGQKCDARLDNETRHRFNTCSILHCIAISNDQTHPRTHATWRAPFSCMSQEPNERSLAICIDDSCVDRTPQGQEQSMQVHPLNSITCVMQAALLLHLWPNPLSPSANDFNNNIGLTKKIYIYIFLF